MAGSYEVVIVVEADVDGTPIPGSPFMVPVTSRALAQAFSVKKTQDLPGSYAQIPVVDAIAVIEALILSNPAAKMKYRFQGQSDAGLAMDAGGIVVLAKTQLNDGKTTNVKASNSDTGSSEVIEGFVAGSNS